MYEDDRIQWFERRGFPDAAENIRLARRISSLSVEERFDEASALLAGITIPMIRKDLEQIIEFGRTCTCIRE